MFREMFSKKEPLKLNDPVFGQIIFTGKNNWEAKKKASFEGGNPEIWIDAGEDGPIEEQRQFYKKIVGGYKELWPRIADAFAKHVEDINSSAYVLNNFTPSILYIPQPREDGTFFWKIWYDRKGDEHWGYGVEIDGWDKIIPFMED